MGSASAAVSRLNTTLRSGSRSAAFHSAFSDATLLHMWCVDFRRWLSSRSWDWLKQTHLLYGKRISFSRSRSEGLRTVCQSCAEQIDRQNRFNGAIGGVFVLAIAGLFLYSVVRNNNSNPTGSGPLVATVDTSSPRTTGTLNDNSHSKEYVIKDGYDALGYDLDLPNMPIRTNTPLECQESCSQNTFCAALVFNKRLKSCFLKTSAGTLFQNDTDTLQAQVHACHK